MDNTCARLHYLAETKLDECHALRDAQVYVDLEPQLNEYKQLQSYARAMSTAKFEACLVRASVGCGLGLQPVFSAFCWCRPWVVTLGFVQVEHEAARGRYERCVRAQLVDFNTLPQWGVGERDCVGGGGPCTRTPNLTLPL